VSARRTEELSRLQRTLGEEVRNYAKANNYDLVLNSEGVVYGTPTYDITAAVLAALQAHGGAAKPSAATPPPAPMPGKPTK
jgi:Skp family chaperone for outer membrane proteins